MEATTAGAEIVNEAYNLITGDRQNSYSHPAEDYQRTVNIFNAMTGNDLTSEEGVMFMVAMKLSRLMHEMDNGMDLPDNTRDAIGYLGCLNMIRRHYRDQESEMAHIARQMRKAVREWA